MRFFRKSKTLASISALLVITTALVASVALGPKPYHVIDRYYLHSSFSTSELTERLVHDRNRDDLVAGLTLDQIRERFRGIPIGNPPNEYQLLYPKADILWIADTPFAIQIKDGKGDHILILKG